jgi:hypothetical protein
MGPRPTRGGIGTDGGFGHGWGEIVRATGGRISLAFGDGLRQHGWRVSPREPFAICREVIMSRQTFDPHEFGVNMGKSEFVDLMAEEFNAFIRGAMSLDELLLRPRQALAFCDEVRRKHTFFDVPDDIILRSVMQRRKNPNA